MLYSVLRSKHEQSQRNTQKLRKINSHHFPGTIEEHAYYIRICVRLPAGAHASDVFRTETRHIYQTDENDIVAPSFCTSPAHRILPSTPFAPNHPRNILQYRIVFVWQADERRSSPTDNRMGVVSTCCRTKAFSFCSAMFVSVFVCALYYYILPVCVRCMPYTEGFDGRNWKMLHSIYFMIGYLCDDQHQHASVFWHSNAKARTRLHLRNAEAASSRKRWDESRTNTNNSNNDIGRKPRLTILLLLLR